MDHLILPRAPVGPQIDVPALSFIGYDSGDYDTYPERQGWGSRPVAQWQNLFQHPTPEFKAFLQRWLYYGFAFIVFGISNISDLIVIVNDKDNSGHLFVRTNFLKTLFKSTLSQGKITRQMIRAIEVCGDAQYCLGETWKRRTARDALIRPERLLEFIKNDRPTNPQDANITLSISLIWELALLHLHYDEQASRNGELFLKPPTLPEYVLRSLFRKAGWCPCDVSLLLEDLTTSGAIFVLNLDRPHPSENHRRVDQHNESQKMLLSDSCTQIYCSHRNLSQETYKTRHIDGCLGCRDFEAKLSNLTDILLNNQIPLISIERPTQSNNALSMKPLKANIPYVAISHVWSDGLGNLQRNSLPECQFNRLRDLVRSFDLPNSNIDQIWIDTLCVPPDSANSDSAQKAALHRMREVYESATAVLVLDSWLASCNISGLSTSEILMRIFHSDWNRRLWTYQEGALAKLLIFQFQDGAVDIDSCYREFLKDRNIFIDLTIRNSVNIKYRGLRHFQQMTRGSVDSLRHIISACKFRATSVAEDEALCLAALMGVDMQRILACHPKSRMQAFWGMVDVIPSDILLYSGERLSEKGFEWAPKSLLVSNSSSNFNHEGRYQTIGLAIDTPVAQITLKGLKFQQSGLVFNAYQTYLGTCLWLIDDKRVHHAFHITFPDQELLQLASCYVAHQPRKTPVVEPLTAYGTTKIAFISMVATGGESLVQKRSGILAAIWYEAEGVFYGKKIATALDEVHEVPSNIAPNVTLDTMYPDPENTREFEGIPLVGPDRVLWAVSGREKPFTQTWCIA